MTLVNLFWIIVFGLVVYMMMKKGGGCCGGHSHDGHNDHSSHGGQHEKSLPPADHHTQMTSLDNEKDPVCGMNVTNASTGREFHGRTYRFCSDRCKQLFDLNPNKYAGA